MITAKKKYFTIVFFLLLGITIIRAQAFSHSYEKNAKSNNRIDSLLNLMTIDEKIGQLNLLTPGGGVATGEVVSKDVESKIKAGQVGGVFGVSSPEKVRQAQEIAVKQSRLGIPLLIGSDVIHGYKTTFPIPLGSASSWDMDLIEKSAQVAAKEATADGIHWNFSPMVDISREPRWGRVAEGAGEDAYLGSQISKAMVKGYQQDDISAPHTMMATVKHLALYGASEAGRDYNTTDMSRNRMFNEYLAPYQAAIDAGVGSVMTSFNDIDGIPASGNKWLLTDLLRNRWNFDGFVVSDYTSVNEMVEHGMGDLQAVSALALNAGLDMDMVGEGFLTTLKKSLEEGKVTEESITNAARRILEAKDRLGLLENPYLYSDESRPEKDILSKENRDLARQVAASSFVLLKKHENTLPLKKDAKIALIGPLANDQNNMLGTWAPTGDYKLSIPILEGMRNAAPNAIITYAKGANITDDEELAEKVNVFGPRAVIDTRTPEEMLEEAMMLVAHSDVVVAVVGEASEMTGESANRTDLNIPESQKKLIRELAASGKPVVLVLMSGRPLTIAEEMALPVNILQIWFPGVEAGNAVADVLFGDYNPSGKLTMTWPRNVGQIPIYYNMKLTGRPQEGDKFNKFRTNYLDVENSPLIPFGHGLSYTEFDYEDAKVSSQELSSNGSITISSTITNSGDYDGHDIAQLYIRDKVRSITPPAKQLIGFQKVFLKKGETKTIEFVITPEDLKFYNSDLEFVYELGDFNFFVAGTSDHEFTGSFELIE